MAGQAAVHQFSIQEFSYSIVSQRDPQSGLPTGQRMHKPVVFAKELGPSTPQLYAALANNENLSEVIFDCYGTQSGVRCSRTASSSSMPASPKSITGS